MDQLDEATPTPIPGVKRPPVPAETAPLADLAAFAACRSRWVADREREAEETLRTTGLAAWEAGWAWSIIKKRMGRGEVFDGYRSFREWATAKSGVSKETVYRWVRVV